MEMPSEPYRRQAAECVKRAGAVFDPVVKEAMLQLAVAYERLAEAAEKAHRSSE